MAFSKSTLRTMLKDHGMETVPSDLLSELCQLHIDTQEDVVKAELAKVSVTESEEYKAVKAELDELKANAPKDHSEELKTLQGKIAEFEAKEKTAGLQAKYTELLTKAGIDSKRHASILKITDLDSVNFEDENTIETLKTEYSDFVVTETTQTHTPATPPQTQTQTKIGRSQIAKMTPEEINKAWADGKIDTTKE